MSNPQSQAAQSAFSDLSRLTARGYAAALPMVSAQREDVSRMLAEGGEPGYVKAAYGAERTGLLDTAAEAQGRSMEGAAATTKGPAGAGNIRDAIGPEETGRSLADALFGSRVNEAMGSLEEQNKLMGFEAGSLQQTGSAAMGAESSRVSGIGYLQPYNSTYANILGVLNAGMAGYGALNTGNPSSPMSPNTSMFGGVTAF